MKPYRVCSHITITTFKTRSCSFQRETPCCYVRLTSSRPPPMQPRVFTHRCNFVISRETYKQKRQDVTFWMCSAPSTCLCSQNSNQPHWPGALSGRAVSLVTSKPVDWLLGVGLPPVAQPSMAEEGGHLTQSSPPRRQREEQRKSPSEGRRAGQVLYLVQFLRSSLGKLNVRGLPDRHAGLLSANRTPSGADLG